MTKPVGVPFEVPTHLRQCSSGYALTDPTAMATRADLMLGYGQERTGHAGVAACLEELLRLADEHNAQMRKIGTP